MGFRSIGLGLITVLAFQVGGCGPKDKVPTTPAQDVTDDLDGATIVKAGEMSGLGNYSVSGEVKLVYSEETDTYSLVFENFGSSNGPDLKVYLSNGEVASPGQFLNLGDLKSVSGTLRYDFPASDFDSSYNFALIWCEQFGVNFGSGPLVEPGS